MTSATLPRATIFVDADNTLWDTDRVFAEAQLQMLAEVEQVVGRAAPIERLRFLREFDQKLAERHHKGLRYPPRLLVQALALALSGTAPGKAVNAALIEGARPIDERDAAAIEERFLRGISQTPPLRTGVVDGLDALHAAGCLVLILTEGSSEQVRSTAEATGLIGHFDRIIEAPKQSRLYERVMRLTGAPQRAFMVGDQLDRDIAPAKRAGLVTIYFPGGFAPRWAPDEAEVGPDYRITSFYELVPIVLGEELARHP